MQIIDLNRVVVLITAGGNGLRLWPLSTLKKPKQFCSLISEKTMLQLTMERVENLVPIERIFVSTSTDGVSFVKQQLPQLLDENIIVEPEGRDTAPAIGYAAVYIENKITDATMVLLAADQYINPIEAFEESILKSIEVAQKGNYLVSVGVVPTKPHTEYGYMECGSNTSFGADAYYGIRYVEKPSLDRAKEFLKAGNYLWNTNIFVWRIGNLLEAFKIYHPESYQLLKQIQSRLKTLSFSELAVLYRQLEKISIDYAILEKIQPTDLHQHIFVAGNFDWSDIGNFTELANRMEVDISGNRCQGFIDKSETKNCTLISKYPYKLYVKGVSELTIVVNEQGQILVAASASTKYLKNLLQLPMSINSTKEKDENGNLLMGMTRLLNTKNLTFAGNRNSVLGCLDVQDLSIKVLGKNVYVYDKKHILPRLDNSVYSRQLGANMELTIADSYSRMSEVAAALLIEDIKTKLAEQEKVRAIFSAGSTPEGIYQLLRTKYKNSIDWRKVVLFQMDDYLDLSSNHPQSFSHYLLTQLIQPLGIEEYYFLNSEFGDRPIDLAEYENQIQEKGGIDLILHGIGKNGHLGFNEPGSSFTSKARVVELAASTINANSKAFNSEKEVPKQGITLGLETISQASKIFLLASGKEKQFAVLNSIFGGVTEDVPASILQTSPSVRFILDKEACSWIKPNFNREKATAKGTKVGMTRKRTLIYAN